MEPDPASADGQVLLELHERGAATFILAFGVAFATVGVAIALWGQYWGLVCLAPLPLFVFLSRNMGKKRLLLTREGVQYSPRRGTPALDVFAAWPTIEQVKLEVKRDRRSDGSLSYWHFLVVERAEHEPIRYLFGSRPNDELLNTLKRICREHDVAVREIQA